MSTSGFGISCLKKPPSANFSDWPGVAPKRRLQHASGAIEREQVDPAVVQDEDRVVRRVALAHLAAYPAMRGLWRPLSSSGQKASYVPRPNDPVMSASIGSVPEPSARPSPPG